MSVIHQGIHASTINHLCSNRVRSFALALDIVSPDRTGKELLARNWGSASRLILYEGPNFSGRAIIANFNADAPRRAYDPAVVAPFSLVR